jgi:hypothetical protein
MGRTRRRRTTTTPTPQTPTEPTYSTRKPEYEDDNVNRMPLLNSPSQVAAAKRVLRQLSARGGRASTRLVSESGVRPYVNSLLGSS